MLAMSDQRTVKGTDLTIQHVPEYRATAARALQEYESPPVSLKATYDLIQLVPPGNILLSKTSSLSYLRTTQLISTALGAIKSRAVSFAGAIFSGLAHRKILVQVQSDLVKFRIFSTLKV